MDHIYFATSLMWNQPLDSIIAFAKQNSFTGIEIWHQQFINTPIDTIQDDLQLLVHAQSWDLNFASAIPAIREASCSALKASIDFAARVGAKEVTIHPGRMTVNNTYEKTFAWLVMGVHELLAYGASRGIVVSIEIMEFLSKEVLVSTDDVKRLDHLCPGCVFTLDLAHCESMQAMIDFLTCGIEISKFHISNRQGQKLHTALGEGDHPMMEMIKRLQTYRKPIVIEGFDDSKDHALMTKNLAYISSKG